MPTVLTSAHAAAEWLRARVSGTLRSDSRQVQPGDGFIAWPGAASDGRSHVAAALAAGAAACLVEHEGVAAFGFDDDRIATLAGLKAAAGTVADDWFGHPSAGLRLLAVTGTNGKTSCSWWLAQALGGVGLRCGLVGTLGIGEPPPVAAGDPGPLGHLAHLQPSGLTTPDPVLLQAALRRYLDQGFAACAIEASSIGLAENRLDGTRIEVALFSNLTRDHLDYHAGMAAYRAAKRRLFGWPGLRAAVVNVDDEYGAELAAELAAGVVDLWTVSRRGPARLQARGLRYGDDGLAFDLHEGGAAAALRSTLVGDYNADNLLLAAGGLRALGLPLADAAAALARVTPVPGRLQRVAGAGIDVVVDYAHTPDALEKVLQALRPLAAARRTRLWCVFGCGGDRDASKRPLMGAIAARGADRVVVTSDNPRHEAPALILAQILAGIGGHDEVAVIEDRRAAIAHAVLGAAPGDLVLVAGKGHEDYQEVAGARHPFSDIEEARAALLQREACTR